MDFLKSFLREGARNVSEATSVTDVFRVFPRFSKSQTSRLLEKYAIDFPHATFLVVAFFFTSSKLSWSFCSER